MDTFDRKLAAQRKALMDRQETEWLKRKADCDARGVCVHSGLQVRTCQETDLCDCFDYEDKRGQR